MGCPDDESIAKYLAGRPGTEEREALTAHFDACRACRLLVADLSSADGGGSRDDEAGAEARYVLLATLGAGAMGVVQAAFDRQLDRKVALKFLSWAPGEAPSRAQARLQREAQALAKLAHPNVVTVHDVGVLDDEVYLAMELVEGRTLRDWLAAGRRSVGEIVAVMRQAGEGLAAAHAAGLVHRDFKPDNVLVGDDGRVRVTDFGLARAATQDEEPGPAAVGEERLATLTATGVRAGTPAYMAPEQRAGEAPSALSDLYSFCVTLQEALTGARPGRPIVRRPSPWLARVIARGLAANPSARWSSMRELLEVLARGPRFTWPRVGVAAVLFAAIAALAAKQRAAPSSLPLCPSPAGALSGIWDDARRALVSAALAGPDGAGRLAYVLHALDAYRDGWAKAQVETCEATRVRGAQSEHMLDLRMACLDDRRRSLGRTTSLLANAAPDVAAHAAEIVAALPGIDACARVRSLQEIPAPPAEATAEVADAKAALDEARGLVFSSQVADALARLEAPIAAMKRVGYAPALAELLLLRGQAEYDVGRAADAERTLSDAAGVALEARDDATLARIWTLRGLVQRGNGKVARAWVDLAGSAIRRLGGDDELEGERQHALAMVSPDRKEAREAALTARALIERTGGPDDYVVAGVDQLLGNAALADGNFADAERYHHRALALRMRLFGPDHAATVSSRFNLVDDALARADPTAARAALQDLEARADRLAADGRGYLALLMGDTARLEKSWAAALEAHRQAKDIYEGSPDAHDADIATALYGVGVDLLSLGRPREAIDPLAKSVARFAPEGEGATADSLYQLGVATFASGDRAGGRELVRRAVAVYAAHPSETDAKLRAEAEGWLRSHGATMTVASPPVTTRR